LLLKARTAAGLPQVPDVLVKVNIIMLDACPVPSKLSITRLNIPNELSCPDPTVKGPGVNPVPEFVPIILLTENVVAFTSRATAPVAPNRYVFPATVLPVNATVAVVLLVKTMVTLP